MQRTRISIATGVGCGGTGGFVEGVVQNQPRMGLGNAKQQRRRQEEAAQKCKEAQMWNCHHSK